MCLCMIGSKGMNFDLAWLQSHLGDIAEVRQAVEKEIRMPPTPLFLLLIIFASGRLSVFATYDLESCCSAMEVRGGRGMLSRHRGVLHPGIRGCNASPACLWCCAPMLLPLLLLPLL